MGKQIVVKKIENGVVLDHLPACSGIRVIEFLSKKVGKNRIILLQNTSSNKIGHKDVVKLEDVILNERDLQTISLFAPSATISIIKNSEVVDKSQVTRPELVKNLLRCPNTSCISNDELEARFIYTRFKLGKTGYVCYFCDAAISFDEISQAIVD